jgi:hypothetical protein
MKKITFLMSFFVAILFVSCGPSVENEQKSWNDNLQKMRTLKAAYPVFAAFIDTKIESAKSIWSQAEGIADKEKKAEKMSEANTVFESGCVGQLSEMKDKMTKLDSKITDVKSAKMGQKGDEKRFANESVDEAKLTLSEVNQILADGKTDITSDPCEVIKRAYEMLTKAYDDLMIAQNKITEKNAASDTVKSNNTNNTTPPPPADIKCEYCGTVNPAANTKCSSCGAPLKK